jgi:2-polyprenyl-3-methyl-5-hydroxy-6-metoxy-1,4-benzoquinol methylase
MDPEATGRSYDKIAHSWQERTPESYGIAQFERAIKFTKNRGSALDIGCGSQGRVMDLLIRHGFQPEGLDVSHKMILLARQKHPNIPFHHADISQWNFPQKYDFVSAWDSTWHLPLELQEPVLRKICAGLAPGGVHLFTTVGFDEPGDHGDSGYMGVPLAYGTMGISKLLELLPKFGCVCRHLEYDQYPEQHLYIIAQKT